ncbi:MAG: ABC transporter ATP-binding protein [Burkholderiales bacterium]|nr:ABC transporter ATP-binding protein [Burkholderiales bacterium]
MRVERLTKDFGATRAVDDVSLACEGGEFLALLGPSGSGKTSILMSIAGFEAPTAGDVWIDGARVTDLPPYRRDIGIVFQSYALFPHMSVRANVGFPLRMRRVPDARVTAEVDAALDLVQLAEHAHKLPSQLSGGQQQRVAIARAIVFRPKLLLMDEPLGALDRRLREDLQVEIKRLQRRLNATIVYVTHDQDEAMLMADRIAVLRAGRLEQIGDPEALFEHPANTFVADFIGQTNLLRARVVTISTAGCTAAIGDHPALDVTAPARGASVGSDVYIAVRPERVRLHRPHRDRPAELTGVVNDALYGGGVRLYVVDVAPGISLKARVPIDGDGERFAPGDRVAIAWERAHARVFADTPPIA